MKEREQINGTSIKLPDAYIVYTVIFPHDGTYEIFVGFTGRHHGVVHADCKFFRAQRKRLKLIGYQKYFFTRGRIVKFYYHPPKMSA